MSLASFSVFVRLWRVARRKAQEQQAQEATEAMRGLVLKLVSDKVTPDTVPITYADFCKVKACTLMACCFAVA